MDICVATSCLSDVRCLDSLLLSLGRFAGLASCNLLVSHNSRDPYLRRLLRGVCESHRPASLHMDFFDPTERVDSNQHGEALNRLFGRTSSRHVVVADPDTIVTSPDWAGFCADRIDAGDFMIGTPYRWPRRMWQGEFPNVWLAMLDGDELRSAGLDMRTEHIRPNSAGTRWKLAPAADGYRDTGWRLAQHAFSRGLGYVSLPASRGGLSSLMRGMYRSLPEDSRSGAAAAMSRLASLRPMEFALPGSGEVCCAHMQGGSQGASRADRWTACVPALLAAAGKAHRD